MDRVSDEMLNKILSAIEVCGFFTVATTQLDKIHDCLIELKARREAERRPDPCVAEWTDMECPKCGHEAVCRDRAGYHCTIDGCGWTKDEGDGTYRP
jgi:ribosomal protein S27E